MMPAADEVGPLLQHAHHLLSVGNRREALVAAERVATLQPGRADWNDALGTVFTYCEEPARALPFYERAVSLSPNNNTYLYNLAAAHRMLGNMATAEGVLDRLIAAQPSHAAAYYMRADLKTQTGASNHVEKMISVLDTYRVRAPDRIMMCFAIAKEADDIGSHELSFRYLQEGCERQRRLFSYDVAADTATIDRIIELHNREALAGGNGLDTPECIFVIGLPRTGTTLVEQILASHPEVHGAGELQAFPAQTIRAVQHLAGRAVRKQDFVALALQVDEAALGRSYIEATRPQTGRTPFFVDKLPTNYLYAGLIRRALPRARLIAVMRDPVDSCFALYRTLFPGSYPFSYNLSELAHYYAAWHRLMHHWQTALGESLLLVQYENLVLEPEVTTRRILRHCGLSWHDACLAFHTNERAVTTASAAQVRRPLYSSSIGKWRSYAQQLQPLLGHLGQLEPPAGWSLGR